VGYDPETSQTVITHKAHYHFTSATSSVVIETSCARHVQNMRTKDKFTKNMAQKASIILWEISGAT